MKFRRYVAATAVLLLLASCGGASSDTERDRNIAGGTEIATSSAPYQVALKYDEVKDKVVVAQYACGGTLIAASWILTAEHCLPADSQGVRHPEQMTVGTSSSDFWTATQDRSTVRYGVEAYAARNTNGPNPQLDLLLLKVDRPFAYSSTLQPAALPIGFDVGLWPARGTKGLISGWGQTLNGSSGQKLRAVEMKVYEGVYETVCGDADVYWHAYFSIPFPDTNLCLIRPSTDVLASACPGDSGGPFIVTEGDKRYVAGVASRASKYYGQPTGPICAGTAPNDYVRVASGVNWIIPGAVRDLAVTLEGGAANLSWSAPALTPALDISDYQIDVRRVGAPTWDTVNDGVSSATTAKIDGLSTGESYEFRVSGINAVNSADAAIRTYANITLNKGVQATTTTTEAATTTTLSVQSTTIAPSTTAKAVTIGTRPTTTVVTTTTVVVAPSTSATTVAIAPPAPAPAPASATSTSVPQPKLSTAEDKSFSSPKIIDPPPATPRDVPTPSESVVPSPQPVVGATWSATDVAKTGNVALPSGGLVSVSVPAKSAKVCKSNGSGLTIVGKGTCKATVSVKSGSGKTKKKTVSIKIS